MEVSQGPVVGLKRRQPCLEDDQYPTQVQTAFNQTDGRNHPHAIVVCECNCISDKHHHCSSKHLHSNPVS